MAQVWLALDLRHDRPVALKILRPELAAAVGVDRFLREIRLTARLQHPNILPVLDSGAGHWRGRRAAPLVHHAARGGRDPAGAPGARAAAPRPRGPAASPARSPTRSTAPISMASCTGTSSPRTSCSAGGHALLADFGVAKLVAGDGSDGAVTSTGLALGTPAYMSPEQAVGDPAVDARTDVYALGCVLYEMLAGEPPYAGPTPQAIVAHRLSDPVPSVRRAAGIGPGRRWMPRSVAPWRRFRPIGSRAADASPRRCGRAAAPDAPSSRPRDSGWWRRPSPSERSGSSPAHCGCGVRRRQRPRVRGPTPLAVLPFQALGVTGDSGVLTVGIPDAIITRLADVHQLRLRPTSAVLRYGAAAIDPQAAARELGVSTCSRVRCSRRRTGSASASSCCAPADGAALWGAHYDLSRQDLLTPAGLDRRAGERRAGACA